MFPAFRALEDDLDRRSARKITGSKAGLDGSPYRGRQLIRGHPPSLGRSDTAFINDKPAASAERRLARLRLRS
jgi:hypothetical protein